MNRTMLGSLTTPRSDRRQPARQLCMLGSVVAVAALVGCVVTPIGPPRQVMVRTAPPAAAVVSNAPLYFYPSRAQTEALQDRDRYECYRWAVRQTGTDPGMTPLRGAPVRSDPARSRVDSRAESRADARDVLGGAATGAVLGAALSSPRNAGSGAVLGAIFGAAVGAAVGEARNRAIDAAQSPAALAQRSTRPSPGADPFRPAMAACMQGRGYNVQGGR